MDNKLRHERILACRYYNGEDKCPQGINEMFWDYECIWANNDPQSWTVEKEELNPTLTAKKIFQKNSGVFRQS